MAVFLPLAWQFRGGISSRLVGCSVHVRTASTESNLTPVSSDQLADRQVGRVDAKGRRLQWGAPPGPVVAVLLLQRAAHRLHEVHHAQWPIDVLRQAGAVSG